MPDNAGFPVTDVGEEGDGIVRLPADDGEVTQQYVKGALPGDRVSQRPGSSDFEIVERASSARRDGSLCVHYPACGSCTVQHMSDAFYTAWKQASLSKALAGVVGDGADTGRAVAGIALERVPLQSRRRAVFGVVAKGSDGVDIGYHTYRRHDLVDLTTCAVTRPSIIAALPGLRVLLGKFFPSGRTLARMTVLDTDGGLDVAIAVEGKGRQRRAAVVSEEAQVPGPVARLTINDETVLQRAVPTLGVDGLAVTPPPGAFVQATVEAEKIMIDIASQAMRSAKAKRIADLFCGLGTFSLPLARIGQVAAIDNDAKLVGALEAASRHATGLKPIATRVRDLHRDPLSPVELKPFDAVIFDPPRAGAKGQAAALSKSSVGLVVAVSCNPVTLARDIALLREGGFSLESITGIDQFIFTPHLEAVAVLKRKGKGRRPLRRGN
ncbi:MAG: class I SAM-dependent RNA methyltransferase [Hyphomicrobiaceae bacterium]